MHRVNGCRQEQNGLGRRVYIVRWNLNGRFHFSKENARRDDEISAVIVSATALTLAQGATPPPGLSRDPDLAWAYEKSWQ